MSIPIHFHIFAAVEYLEKTLDCYIYTISQEMERDGSGKERM